MLHNVITRQRVPIQMDSSNDVATFDLLIEFKPYPKGLMPRYIDDNGGRSCTAPTTGTVFARLYTEQPKPLIMDGDFGNGIGDAQFGALGKARALRAPMNPVGGRANRWIPSSRDFGSSRPDHQFKPGRRRWKIAILC